MLNAADAGAAPDDPSDGPQIPHRADPEQAAAANGWPIATDRGADAPAFLTRSSGFGLQPPTREVSRRQNLPKALAARLDRLRRIWRGHLVQDAPNTAIPRRSGGIGGGTFALLTLLVLAICAGGLLALGRIRSLKTEIASLQRELLPLRERLASLEQAEKAKLAEIKAESEKSKALAENPFQQAPLTFSREEAQLIREYIKPAPPAGPTAPAVNVGDPVTGGTIPLPSPLAEKMPKLVGARFAIRNGAIIIVRRDSRKVDAVLPPY
ncbi:hypothetical protein A5906_35115 [Bradyrhizobium sacchari]|uniref:Uncharacterized protein n=1 Tax=Bradyrhizobium sacchari TaxID=1399419 RepID=A0A560JTH2_9BRAD|nr:hypothetical protein [Bradyrhizobium sacchari]OPY98164.1 hypothetical protein A5906_35115 [Bradyrhizobium sacchari]TWB58846.1 hypothetical protein FBZ94_105122 [Bradyrhizobium sacchari]TWB72794.1 hypothetical protein FBZ95_106509 [Bradyrhizobium sacchari]